MLDGMFCCSSSMSVTRIIVYAALGMTEDVELLSLKGTKKKRGKKLDEDFEVWHRSLWGLHSLSHWTLPCSACPEAIGGEGCSKSDSSHSANFQSKAVNKTAYTHQGLYFILVTHLFLTSLPLAYRGPAGSTSVDALAWVWFNEFAIGRLYNRP